MVSAIRATSRSSGDLIGALCGSIDLTSAWIPLQFTIFQKLIIFPKDVIVILSIFYCVVCFQCYQSLLGDFFLGMSIPPVFL